MTNKRPYPAHNENTAPSPAKSGGLLYSVICGALCCLILCSLAYCLYLSVPAEAVQKLQPQIALKTQPETKAQFTPNPQIAAQWHPLLERLKNDDMYGVDVDHWFASFTDEFSSKPMGAKVTTLFKKRFIPPHFAYFRKPLTPPEFYPGVITTDNVVKCLAFLQTNAEIFQKAEAKYIVPKEVLVSLLMVETRLGTFTGSEKAFWSLACMAASDTPASVQTYLERLPYTEAHGKWLQDVLTARSQWAYTELKALIMYCRLHEHNPLEITGSIYGAIGLCQFMPSNIPFYAVDGNGDGKIDLFTLEDAVPSAANFLKTHGWKQDSTKERKARLLRYYNNSTAYANTILALADAVNALAVAEAQKNDSNATAQTGKEG